MGYNVLATLVSASVTTIKFECQIYVSRIFVDLYSRSETKSCITRRVYDSRDTKYYIFLIEFIKDIKPL